MNNFILLVRRACRKTLSVWDNTNQRRYKYKPKWAQQYKKSSSCQRALDHFDAFYKPVYGELWPAIRLSLLSLPKHCAVVNKFSDVSRVQSGLERIGSFNVLNDIRDETPVIHSLSKNSLDDVVNVERNELEVKDLNANQKHFGSSFASPDSEEEVVNKPVSPSELTFILDGDNLEPYDEDLYKDNLDVFVPPEPMVTEKEKMLEEEIQMSSFRPRDMEIDTVPMESVVLSTELNSFVFPPGDVSKFPQPKVFNQASGYYLMDAASLLPVLALNINPCDRVLDLCAAPGGKSFVMLQTLDLDSGGVLHCNDSSQSRISRLKNVLKSYIPSGVSKDVIVTQRDGLTFNAPEFDKVLVDVPCNTDRHVVNEEENNLFKVSRSHERLQIMRRQRDLLVSAIKSCAIGGSIVYSTCTLALAQNDGVIQAAVERLRENSQIDVVVQDLSPLAKAFESHFKFFDRCRYGQLVLPCMSQNFGPLYFAKLKRIR